MLPALIETSIHRRVAVLGLAAILSGFGVYAYLRTPIEAYPDVTNVQVNVIARLPGLAPEEVERQITIPLERVLNGTPGTISLRSESLFGLSLIYLTFEDGEDMFRARTMISERMRSADLPEGSDVELAPEYTPLGEIYQYRLTSDRHDLYELRAEQEWTVARHFKQLPGVADVVSFGGYLKEVHVEVEPSRLQAHDLTLRDVTEALERSNLNVGGGVLQHGEQELIVRSIGYLRGAPDIQNVVLRSQGGTPVTVGDVARVLQSYTPRRGTVGINLDREAVEGFVLLRRGENPSDVLDEVHAKVTELNEHILPQGMRIEPFVDRTTLVSRTLGTVHHNLLFGGFLILAIVWLFLRTLRGSLIVTSVIPFSLLCAFTGLFLLGMPANLISMGAIDFGIIVDGAVILVENVVHQMRLRRPESHRETIALVSQAALDVARPAAFSMAIIIAALIPVFTLQRVEGRIFRPLALTYSFTLVAALLSALTIVPALCALALRSSDAGGDEPRTIEWLRAFYARRLAWLLGQRRRVVGAAIGLLALGALVGLTLGTEFLPQLNEGDMVIFVEMPPSMSLQQGQIVLQDVRRRILTFPEVVAVMSEQGRPEDGTDDEGVNMSETFVHLKTRSEWRHGVDMDGLIDVMRASLTEIPGVRFNFSQPIKDNVEEAVSGVRGQVVLKIFGTDLEAMRTTLQDAVTALKAVPGIVDLNIYREATVPQLQLRLDRAALAREGIAVADAQEVIETSLAGRVVTNYWEDERVVPVRVMLPAGERSDAVRIGDVMARTSGGGHIPLRQLASIETTEGRAAINRESNSRVMALKFNVAGRDLGSVIAEAQRVVAAKVKVPERHYFVWTGEFENQRRAMARLEVIVPIALLLVLLLLYSALGSARCAAAILLVAPFSMTGGIFALRAANVELSVSAVIGFIALLGQVSLAGLLVVSAIESRRREGSELVPAILDGCTGRLRALLMTALLAIMGLFPMAVSTGVGSETQRPFALVIVGGMVTTLLVALTFLPVLYALISNRPLRTPEEEDLL